MWAFDGELKTCNFPEWYEHMRRTPSKVSCLGLDPSLDEAWGWGWGGGGGGGGRWGFLKRPKLEPHQRPGRSKMGPHHTADI